VLLVKNLLYEEKYTIEGANKKLLEMRREGELKGEGHEVVAPDFLTGIKAELEELRTLLTPLVPGADR
jgi:hypothetical protein